VSGKREIGRRDRAVHNARRLWPFVMMAWRRWQDLSPAQRERYKRQAREYAQRGRDLAARKRRGSGR
jgi:hypothetical protein